MPEELIKKIAAEIASEAMWGNSYFYLLVIMISIISGAVASYCSSYFRKRGEFLATRADFQEILTQLEKTTETAETIKSEISIRFTDEAARKILFREKLETFIETTFELDLWIEKAQTLAKAGADLEITSAPIGRLEAYQLIYFRDLNLEVSRVKNQTLKIQLWLIQQRDEVINAKSTSRIGDVLQFGATSDYLMPMYLLLIDLRKEAVRLYSEKAGLMA